MATETEASSESKALPVAFGVLVGVLVFVGLNTWYSRPFIPTIADLPTVPKEPFAPTAAALAAATPSKPLEPGELTFQTVCAACHQANAMGLAGTFPPLAESPWANGDPETPVRIVLMGLQGAIEVKGATYTSLMPPPPGLDDQKIADVLTFVRSHFGNKASANDKAKVAEIRAAIAARGKPWTAPELSELRPK